MPQECRFDLHRWRIQVSFFFFNFDLRSVGERSIADVTMDNVYRICGDAILIRIVKGMRTRRTVIRVKLGLVRMMSLLALMELAFW